MIDHQSVLFNCCDSGVVFASRSPDQLTGDNGDNGDDGDTGAEDGEGDRDDVSGRPLSYIN